jgi:hypothetical protein
MLNATPEEKLAYTNIGRWDRPTPYSLGEAPDVGAGNRDVLYSAQGFRQLPAERGQGVYKNSQGEYEYNPLTVSRVLADFPTGGGGLIAEPTRHSISLTERLRALIDAQEAGAANLGNTMDSVKGKNALVLDTRHLNPNKLKDPSMGVMPNKGQLEKLIPLLENEGYGIAPSSRGAVIFPFDESSSPKQMQDLLKKHGNTIKEIYPSNIEKSLNSMTYVPGVGKYHAVHGIVPTEPYSGQATMGLLREAADLPHEVSMNIGESEGVRKAIQEKMKRDAPLPGARGDIQETRRFFSEADWPKAVNLIRHGMTPAAALAALGYSASSMAGEKTK